jgi:hypothetical protein
LGRHLAEALQLRVGEQTAHGGLDGNLGARAVDAGRRLISSENRHAGGHREVARLAAFAVLNRFVEPALGLCDLLFGREVDGASPLGRMSWRPRRWAALCGGICRETPSRSSWVCKEIEIGPPTPIGLAAEEAPGLYLCEHRSPTVEAVLSDPGMIRASQASTLRGTTRLQRLAVSTKRAKAFLESWRTWSRAPAAEPASRRASGC